MPEDSLCYVWGVLQETNIVNMVRPYKTAPFYWSYHEDTDEVDDPDLFAEWVLAHPGRIWLIGNEPDLPTQDDITQDQYARMFHKYYKFISSLDPTAQFAIAGIYGGDYNGAIERCTNWLTAVLDSYRLQFGEDMPIDIWNIHVYATPNTLDPWKVMDEFVNPFCEWVKTVNGGIYENCPIWITEFGVALWSGDMSRENIRDFMDVFCRLLEGSDVDKWFWFIGYSGGEWQATSLIYPWPEPSILGEKYVELAWGYPNTPPEKPDPALPEPPPIFRDDFNSGLAPEWKIKAGDWVIDEGALRQCDKDPYFAGQSIVLMYRYSDFVMEVDVKINSTDDPNRWAGLVLRMQNKFDMFSNSGYLIYLRQNGELGLYTQPDGTVASDPEAVEDTSVFHRLKVEIELYTIKVYVDDALKLEWTDPNRRYPAGFVSLQTNKADCSFDNFRIKTRDYRFGVVATDTSGYGGPVTPMQGEDFFSPLRTSWWYNYLSNDIEGKNFPGYQRLYMFWRATLDRYTDEELQDMAHRAKEEAPYHTIWWAMSNEVNDRGQANQSATEFARIYLKYHKNLKIGDPTCKVMGPSILNWDFVSTSVYQSGKSWYEEFRQAWYNDPECREYSLENYGIPYPPMDAFNFHTYDLRGVQGTPYAPESWEYCRDQILLCYNDLQNYPETAGKKIWLTEFGGLRSPNMTVAADRAGGLILWMRQQPFIQRWFLFFIHNDYYGSWPALNLLDDYGNLTPYGRMCRDFAWLDEETHFLNIPYHRSYQDSTSYTRVGWYTAGDIREDFELGMRFYLVNGQDYTANTMHGRVFDIGEDKIIERVTFNYYTNYDSSKLHLALDVPDAGEIWSAQESSNYNGYADIDFSSYNTHKLAFSLCVDNSFTYSEPTGQYNIIITNITFYYRNILSTPWGLLKPGWNLISIPLIPYSSDVRDVFSSILLSDTSTVKFTITGGINTGEFTIGIDPSASDGVDAFDKVELYPAPDTATLYSYPDGLTRCSVDIRDGAGLFEVWGGSLDDVLVLERNPYSRFDPPMDVRISWDLQKAYGWHYTLYDLEHDTSIDLSSTPFYDTTLTRQDIELRIEAEGRGNTLEGNIYRYSENGYAKYPDDFSNIETGVGYWIYITEPSVLRVEGYTPTIPQRIQLKEGWNLIGYPFPVPQPVDGIYFEHSGVALPFPEAQEAGWVQGTIYYFDEGYKCLSFYGPDNCLEPWRGYWILALVDDLDIIINPPE